MSRPKGPRGLKPEERALWHKIAERTRPLRPEKRSVIERAPAAEEAAEAPAPPPTREPIAPFRVGQTAASRDHVAALPAAPRPVQMDSKAHRKMTRGKLKPEARIDLHGMTQDRAHGELNRFILGSHAAGRRLVLVITGKGKSGEDDGPIPVRRGVLRHQVPHWLTTGVLGSVVLEITPAHQRHGGAGAFYVYLRRNR